MNIKIAWGEYFNDLKFSIIFSIPILGSYVDRKFQNELLKQEKSTILQLQKGWDQKKCNSMPEDGMSD